MSRDRTDPKLKGISRRGPRFTRGKGIDVWYYDGCEILTCRWKPRGLNQLYLTAIWTRAPWGFTVINFQVEGTRWNSTLKGMSWRVDTQSRSRHVDQLNSVSALVELQIADPQKPSEVRVCLHQWLRWPSQLLMGKAIAAGIGFAVIFVIMIPLKSEWLPMSEWPSKSEWPH